MSDPRRTVVAGLAGGVLVLGAGSVAGGIGGGLDVVSLVCAAVFVVAATALLAVTRFGVRGVVLTWLAAVAVVATWLVVESSGPGFGLGLLAGAWFGTLAVAPWLLATAVVRHLLAGSRP